MELLAPAGSFPAFEAALEQGADSIYVGAPGLNARALSRDFTMAEIDSMVRQARNRGVRVYIAMNSLVKENELPRAVEALACFAEIGPDALIIQDLGLLYLAKTWFPELVLHASTLMSVHNSMGARELSRLGFDRVVLARELTLEEMAVIARKSGAEIEVFIHGAMCFSYSGLCMFSSLHGGKSSLRGQCVQPCRRHYSWLKNTGSRAKKGGDRSGSYIFSMNDLCGVDVLPELRAAGVSCLKIEGRMKSASYVANTVAAYRMALDSMDAPEKEQERVLKEAHRLLDDAMARSRSTGFLLSARPTEAVTPERSGSSGTLLGRVRDLRQERARDGRMQTSVRLRLTAQVAEGDRLRLHDEKSGERVGFTLRSLLVQGKRRKTAEAGQDVVITCGRDVQAGGKYFKGSLFKVDVGSRIAGERSGRQRSRKLSGRNVRADRNRVEEILGRLGWKRSVPEHQSGRGGRKTGKHHPGRKTGRRDRRELPWWVVLAGIADINARLPVRPARILVPVNRDNMHRFARLSGKIGKKQGKIIWCLPVVVQEQEIEWYRQQVEMLIKRGYTRFELGHCSQYGFFLSAFEQGKRIELFGRYTLNLLNSAALQGAGHLGLRGVVFSLETEKDNLSAALASFRRQESRGRSRRYKKLQIGMYVYGRPPLFTARLDSDHFNYRQQVVSPREETYTLEHRDGLTLARSTLPFSLLAQQQEPARAGLDYLVLDLSGGPLRKEAATVAALLGGARKRIQVLTGNYSGTLV
jgi:putative protease